MSSAAHSLLTRHLSGASSHNFALGTAQSPSSPAAAVSPSDGPHHQAAFPPFDANNMKRSRSPSSATADKPKRLPVNQRRNKVAPENRKRVAAACNACNVRRTKCSGERPCQQCHQGNRTCEYPERNDKISVSKTEFDDLKRQLEQLKQTQTLAVNNGYLPRDSISSSASVSTVSPITTSSATLPGREAPENDSPRIQNRVLTDPCGVARFLGSTSGATFLDLVKDFMCTTSELIVFTGAQIGSSFMGSRGRVQTSDSQPLQIKHNLDLLRLPSRTVVNELLNRFKFTLQDGNGDFLSGGIYFWGDLDSTSLPTTAALGSGTAPANRRLALYHATFALSSLLKAPLGSEKGLQQSEVFFSQARLLLGNPLDTTSSSEDDIPALALLSLYLVENNRRDTAYMYISLGMHLAIMHGIHCTAQNDQAIIRAFWTLYILDRWMCCLMGRPPAISDEAIHLPPLSDARGFPPVAGLKAHVELSKICGHIICETYGIAPKYPAGASSNTASRIDTALEMLAYWKENLPEDLRLDIGRSSAPDRACFELHMTYNQLVILTIRPLLLAAVRNAVIKKYTDMHVGPGNLSHARLRLCRDAARENLGLGRRVQEMMRASGSRLLSWSLHAIFNSALLLLLGRLLFDDHTEHDSVLVDFAIQCFKHEAEGGGNYPRDCCVVLDDLQSLTWILNSLHNRAPLSTPLQMQQELPATTACNLDHILHHDLPPHILPSNPSYNAPQAGLYHTLTEWSVEDEFEMYNSFPGMG